MTQKQQRKNLDSKLSLWKAQWEQFGVKGCEDGSLGKEVVKVPHFNISKTNYSSLIYTHPYPQGHFDPFYQDKFGFFLQRVSSMNDDGMETDEETGGAGTNSGAVDDEEFSRILDGESEENDDEDSDSGLEDPEKALKLQQDCGLSRSIRNFVRFMMGMPATISEYPAAPNRSQRDLWHHWAETRYDKMVKHLAEYTEKHNEVSKSVFKEMYTSSLT
ncbi:hypothetical protein PGTUg99_003834 [Puccinia graminis f. sp. tritici]|uniref:Uncharacterized protein n=1 Tax=Puccinia graminis f. sp. tritici TaxID=56615 RepID=A0A5B0Q1J5_PUCGR|nr:hypothetical protein PGTUg99_003834 [Puccinia graminis f. sp. tritici]